MTFSKSNPRAKPRWLLLAAIVAIASLAYGATVLAVHDLGNVELDANTLDDGNIPADDWAALFNAAKGTDNTINTADDVSGPLGSEGFVFVADKLGTTGDNTYWTGGGSKDRNDIPSWQWSTNDQSPDKNDIENAFAATYTDGADRLLYFGADRFSVSGDAQMGFWFLSSRVCLAGTTLKDGSTCPNTNPGKFVDPDTGALAEHQDGDLLALVNFNNGGSIGLAAVYRWDVATGAPVLVLTGSGIDCTTIVPPPGTSDTFCTTSNKADLTNEPVWAYASKLKGKTINYYQTSAFIEGGIDLGAITGAAQCFPSFIAETRSSSGPSTGLSLDAQLKDLAFGEFELCGSTTTTTPKQVIAGTPPTLQNIPSGGTSITTAGSIEVVDQATVAVTGATDFGGDVTFYLCGPTPLADTDYTLCSDETGDQIGAAKAIDETTLTVTSDPATLTSAGRYCWSAVYSGDPSIGLKGSEDSSATECFKVTPVTPTLTTLAVNSAGAAQTTPVPFGDPVYDTANLQNTARQPGSGGLGTDGSIEPTTAGLEADGTITFKLYGPVTVVDGVVTAGCNTLATDFPSTGIVVDIDNGGDGTYGGAGSTPAVSFIPKAPGVYHWKAEYSGDAPNTNGDTHNSDCSDTNEDVTVQQLQPTIVTAQRFVPNDSATVTVGTGGGNLAGSVRFRLYDNATCSPAGTTLYDKTFNIVTEGTGTGLIRTVSTDNTTAYNTSKNLSWLVEYTSTNSGHTNVTSTCGIETMVVTIDNDTTAP